MMKINDDSRCLHSNSVKGISPQSYVSSPLARFMETQPASPQQFDGTPSTSYTSGFHSLGSRSSHSQLLEINKSIFDRWMSRLPESQSQRIKDIMSPLRNDRSMDAFYKNVHLNLDILTCGSLAKAIIVVKQKGVPLLQKEPDWWPPGLPHGHADWFEEADLKVAVPGMLRVVNAEQFWEALKSLKSLESESVERRILELVFWLKKLEESNELMDFISYIAELQRPSTTDGTGDKLSKLRGIDEQNGA